MPGFARVAFTDAVRALQERYGSRTSYAKMESRESGDVSLGADEMAFIESRDSFYMASVSSDGWPYVQHRGGPRGFLRAIDATHLEFADYGGNRQYITTGNIANNDRVALFLMDYPSRSRLKILAHVTRKDHTAQEGRTRIERVFELAVVAWDWNCPQHITPRYTIEEIKSFAREK
ncbi:MAG: pyridoxamine 5'-phosphate oxidase family protein [Candidatus Eremiobacteraeota bacterium]|nr:pyridoxamine 5'-phosphate oxidase family protein [Candidatus Eremiobacteraeota bacterium]